MPIGVKEKAEKEIMVRALCALAVLVAAFFISGTAQAQYWQRPGYGYWGSYRYWGPYGRMGGYYSPGMYQWNGFRAWQHRNYY